MSTAAVRRTRVVIADDEPLARERLRMLLAGEPWVDVVRECEDGTAAVAAIRDLRPDLVFLDLQMPGATGFEVIEQVGPARMPAVVFVTAYDQFALRAFEVRALDYLLKPFDRERFQQALSRAREQLQRTVDGELERRLLELMHDINGPSHRADRFVDQVGRPRLPSSAPPTWTGSRRRATTSSCTPAATRTCCARR